MQLNEINDNPGSRKRRMRVGRGIGSGKGKTCGRGGKGQTARSGVAIGGFEGGQMPLYQRLPKRGFKNPFRKSYSEITLARLQSAVDSGKLTAGADIDDAALVKAGVLRRSRGPLRVLGTGELKAKLNLKIAHASAGVIKAIEKAGGKVSLIQPAADAADEAKA